MKPPNLILFDIGSVIIDVDHSKIANGLANFSTNPQHADPVQVLTSLKSTSSTLINSYDKGNISSRDFFNQISSTYELDIDFPMFKTIWNSCFSENKEVSSLVQKLSIQYKIFLLSNTNAMHYEFLYNTFPVIKNIQTAILSYEVHSRKPEIEIYQHALKLGNVPAHSVWYVDDRIEFVNAATKLGIHSIQFEGASKLRKALQPILDSA